MDPETSTIAEIAAGSVDFETLTAALEAADLTGAVADMTADLTVLAPTDAAFATLAEDLGYDGDPEDADAVFAFIAGALGGLAEDGDPIPLLTDVLLYHVIAGAQTAAEIAAADSLTPLLGGATIIPAGTRLIDAEPDILDAEIVTPDVDAANGIIQIVDRVLLPIDIEGNDRETIADIASDNDDFEVLSEALSAADLESALDGPTDEFTVFAPTDTAFAELAVSLGFEGDTEDEDAVFAAIADALAGLAEDGDPIPVLTDILLYHVVAGAQTRDELAAGGPVTTLQGGNITPTETEVADLDSDAANPAYIDGLTDLPASNGLIQAIDGVLLPIDLDLGEPMPEPTQTIAEIVAASGDGFDDDNGDFDMLLAALTAADLVTPFTDPDATFTVFAPTDAAFIGLAQSFGSTATDEETAFNDIVATLTALDPDGDPIPLLTDVLLFHVTAEALTREDLAASPTFETLLGGQPTTDATGLSDNDPGVADAAFIDAASDIGAVNGIIQAIDGVLLPIDVPEAASTGGDGDDSFTITDATRSVDGGGGTDRAVFEFASATAALDYEGEGFSVSGGAQPVTITDVEEVEFTDGVATFDDSDAALEVARLYEAALGRAPDIPGGTFWIAQVEAGQNLSSLADDFLDSMEFADRFGTELDHGEYVDALYGNVLGRAPDDAGRAFWVDTLAEPDFSPAQLLQAFARSSEFEDNTAETFSDGILAFA